VPFREEYADIEGNFLQATVGLAHIVSDFVPVRSGHLNAQVLPVPESGSDLIEAVVCGFAATLAIELAVVFDTTGDVPALAADILDQFLGSVLAVELHVDDPTLWQQGSQGGQDAPGQAVLAAERNALPRFAPTIEPPDGFGSQV
jgi:hypothetical protein